MANKRVVSASIDLTQQISSDGVDNKINKYITNINDTGIKVHPKTGSSLNYTQINGNGLEVFKDNGAATPAAVSVAYFGSDVRVGSTSQTGHIRVDSTYGVRFLRDDDQTKMAQLASDGLQIWKYTAADDTTDPVTPASNTSVAFFGATARIGDYYSKNIYLSSSGVYFRSWDSTNNECTYDGYITGTSARIGAINMDGNIYINTTNGLSVYNAGQTASYLRLNASGIRVGTASGSRVEIGATNGMNIFDENNNVRLNASSTGVSLFKYTNTSDSTTRVNVARFYDSAVRIGAESTNNYNVFITDEAVNFRKGTTVTGYVTGTSARFGAVQNGQLRLDLDSSNIKFISRSDGVDSIIAQFSDSVTLGNTAKAHALIDSSSFKLQDKESNTYFYISDLRNEQSVFSYEYIFPSIPGGTLVTNDTIDLPFTIVNDTSLVIKDGNNNVLHISSVTNNSTSKTCRIVLEEGFLPGDTVYITAKSTSPYLKAYTLGIRDTDEIIGFMSLGAGKNIAAKGFGSLAVGEDVQANNNYSVAFGNGGGSGGIGAISCGMSCISDGYGSASFGSSNQSLGDYSFTCGELTQAYDWSFAGGRKTKAIGYGSTAFGYQTEAKNWYTFAAGTNTRAYGANQFVIGASNVAYPSSYSVDLFKESKYVFIIGNGGKHYDENGDLYVNNSTYSDALKVDWKGNVDISGNLTSTNSASGGEPALVVNGTASTAHKVGLIIGGSSRNGGIWDYTNNKWVVYSTPAGVVTLNGNAATATSATNVTGTVAIANGGTGATTAAAARTNLGVAAASHTHSYLPLSGGTLTGQLYSTSDINITRGKSFRTETATSGSYVTLLALNTSNVVQVGNSSYPLNLLGSSIQYNSSALAVNSGPTLSWGTTSTIGTVAGVALKVTMPANPNTNTDTKVTQGQSTANETRRLLFKYDTGATAVTNQVYHNGYFYVNPSTGKLFTQYLRISGLAGTTGTYTSNILRIDSQGDVGVASGTTSSIRYKTSIDAIHELSLQPEQLYKIPVVQFKYKDTYLDKSDLRFDKLLPGFIAEDVYEHYPIAVDLNDDGEPENWNLAYIVPPMLALIQKQHKEIEELKQELTEIKSIIAKLLK